MKFATVLAFVAAVTVVSAETNAQRFARGLGPMSPSRRSTRPLGARHSTPSSVPKPKKPQHCCESFGESGIDSLITELLDVLDTSGKVPKGTECGANCQPVGSSGTCPSGQTPVCCSGENYDNGTLIASCVKVTV